MDERLLCARVRSGITDYLDGALTAQAHLRFEAHLRSCRSCRNQLRRMLWTVDLLSKLPGATMPVWMKRRLEPQVRSTLRSPPSSLHRCSPTALSTRVPDL